jgi:hypothetical protein
MANTTMLQVEMMNALTLNFMTSSLFFGRLGNLRPERRFSSDAARSTASREVSCT